MPMFASLYNLAHWLTQDRSEAEDLVQETYAKALKGFDSFQLGTNFRAWIYRILRNTFLTSKTGLRATKTEALEEDDPSAAAAVTAETPESIYLARADQEAIQSALRELPVSYREIILLCDVEELSYREISEALSIPLGTVMSRLSRARKAMRGLLAESVQGTRR